MNLGNFQHRAQRRGSQRGYMLLVLVLFVSLMALATMAAAPKVVQQIQPEVIRKGFIDPDNLALVRQGMLDAVEDPAGTACCRIKQEVPVQVGAKTGTAETVVHDDGSGAANQSKAHAWFEAFAPYNNPQIVVVVVLEHAGEGADYAAPAVRETLAWYFTQGAGKAMVGH